MGDLLVCWITEPKDHRGVWRLLQMERILRLKRIFTLLLLPIFLTFCAFLVLRDDGDILAGDLMERQPFETISSITPINGSKHLMVSAFVDHRLGEVVRIISIIHRNTPQQFFCIYYSETHGSKIGSALTHVHIDHFDFPFATADVLCQHKHVRHATHITLSTVHSNASFQERAFLPIQNKEKKKSFQYNFTVCLSNLFGDYNNVLQFVQTMEMYKLLGVDHVVLYNTSCGPDLEKLLQQYRKEGFLEVVPWPINQFLNPSTGWNFVQHKGDIHYYGQLTTLNECIYRHMYQSKYVLLNDIDEIIMPYQHKSLSLLIEELQKEKPTVSIFAIENHIFPQNIFDDSGKFTRREWEDIPGINILEHIHREPELKNGYHPFKMIVNPRSVIQTSVHTVLRYYGLIFRIPFDVCRIIHVRVPIFPALAKEKLFVDDRLWDFQSELIRNVNMALRMSGLLKVEEL